MFNFIQKITRDTREIPFGVKLVVLVLFLRSFGWGFVDPFYSMFVQGFSTSYSGVGSLISIVNLASLLALIPLIRLADKVQHITIMRDGELIYLVAILFYLLAAYTRLMPFLIIAFILNGIAYPFVIVGAETYIRKKCKGRNEGASFGFYTALHYLGWILGMLVSAYTIQFYGFNLMFIFILPSILAGFLILRHVKESGLKSIFSGFRRYLHRRQDFVDMWDDLKSVQKRTYFFLLLAFFDGILVMFAFIFIPLLALSLGFELKEIALLMAATYIPFLFSFFVSELSESVNRMTMIAFGLLIGALSFIFLSLLSGHFWVLTLTMANSLALAIIRPSYNGVLTHITPRRILGEVTSLNNIMMRLGYVVGPIFIGFFADHFGLTYAFYTLAIFALILSAISLLFRGYEVLVPREG